MPPALSNAASIIARTSAVSRFGVPFGLPWPDVLLLGIRKSPHFALPCLPPISALRRAGARAPIAMRAPMKADVLNIAPLPEDLRADPALLCGCIAGAISADRTESLLREAGFVDVAIAINPKSRETVASWAPGRGIEKCVASAMVEACKPPRR
jgi:hypothetical protein